MHPKLLRRSLLIFLLVGGAAGAGRVLAQGPAVAGLALAQRPAGAASGPGAEDSVLIRRLADTILTDGITYDNLRVLTKTVGARLSGSAGYYKAEKWGQAALQAAGSDKVWLQECMVPHWVRGGKDEAEWVAPIGATEYGRQATPGAGSAASKSPAATRGSLDILALGNSVGTGPKGVTAPVMLVNNFDELEKRKDEAKGKIVFYNYPFNPLFVETFEAYGDAVSYRGAGASRAAKYGAVAVLVRSMSSSVNNDPHTGSLNYSDSTQKIPAAAVGLRDADKLARLVEAHPKEVSVFLRTHAQMLPDTPAHNVIGELRGSEFPDQVITVGGHLDSWDPAEGAMDDGTGCVQSIEVLRALKAIGYIPRHTIRIVLFANEENGGRGGRAYAAGVKAQREKPLVGLESDNGGFTPRGFTLSMDDERLAGVQPWIRFLKPYGVYEMEKGGGGSDVNPLSALGAVVGELRPDSQRYFEYHHSRGDVLEAVNKRELELGAVNMAALVYLMDKYGF